MKPITSLFLSFMVVNSVGCSSHRVIAKLSGYAIAIDHPLPKGYTKTTGVDDHRDSEIQYKYPNGSIVYITDDKIGSHNSPKAQKYGQGIYDDIAVSDSLDLDGQSSGTYWREVKRKRICYGYLRVDSANKDAFDSIINSIHIKKLD